MAIAHDPSDTISEQAERRSSPGFSRRQFMGGLAALTLAIGFKGNIALAAQGGEEPLSFKPNAFIRINQSGVVSVISPYLEMGQGTFTGLATMAAEELDVTMDQVVIETTQPDLELYANPILAKRGFVAQVTGGSTAMAGAWTTMRQAAAVARAMLLTAAAKQWNVAPSELTVVSGEVVHAASGRRIGYGNLVAAAMKEPLPTEVKVKNPAAFTLIGKETLKRLDVPDKVNGRAIYTQDIQLPGILVASIAHPPRLWGKVRAYDEQAALAVTGVVAVVQVTGDQTVQGGVAVLARNTWAARAGRDALKVQWDNSDALNVDSMEITAKYRQLSETPGLVAEERGAVLARAPAGGTLITATYEQPYLAHAPMEPMNCVVRLSTGQCEIWNGEQWHTGDNAAVAKELALDPKRVIINQLYAGGSFGRRANPRSDYMLEAVRIAKAARARGIEAPIKMVWMREDDMRGVQYRPLTVHRVEAALDASGQLVSWHHRVVGQTFMPSPESAKKVDRNLLEGTYDTAYLIPNFKVEQHSFNDIAIPTMWLRSVGHTHTAYVMETLIDELAFAAKRDPVDFRRELLRDSPRDLGVLELVARKSGWGSPLASGGEGARRARGIAVHSSFGTFVAHVAEVTLFAEGDYLVDRVVSAVDCGTVINPDIVRAQVEGGIAFGMSFLNHGITFKQGEVVESNFHDYPVLRMNAMPRVEVHLVASQEAPTGIGEPPVPPAAPAVANALAAITGKRHRTLPLRKDELV